MMQNINESEKTSRLSDESDIANNFNHKKIKDNTVIYILTAIILMLLIYLFGMKFTDRQNLEISEYYTAFSTEVSEENSETQKLSVNINSDDIFELSLLPGIGTSKAEAIIEYRKENGDFDDINELLNVPGIGEAIFANLKEMIVIE
ncbi:MAG: helix-hairpin-helix domain-containing protein [Clostridia bacterium]|nr:helix-hairpin-helix domain-containing protein [Clostridia bacterium]